jgi:hypothetical protein
VVDHILQIFAEASGLVANMSKTHYYPIRCEGINLDFFNTSQQGGGNFPLHLPWAAFKNQEAYQDRAPASTTKDSQSTSRMEERFLNLPRQRVPSESRPLFYANPFSHSVQAPTMGYQEHR